MCAQMDELRKLRQQTLSKINYLKSINKGDAVVEEQQRIREIDAKIAPLHAAAKQQVINGISESLARDATVLQDVAKDIEIAGDAMAEENERHY